MILNIKINTIRKILNIIIKKKNIIVIWNFFLITIFMKLKELNEYN